MNKQFLPNSAGIGFKAEHYQQIIQEQPDIAWFEIHPENFFCDGGQAHSYLEKLRSDYPLSMHGVGMNLGGAQALNNQHLKHLKNLIQRYQPQAVSEHLAWCQHEAYFLNDLLPLPYTQQALDNFVEHVLQAQENLGVQLLIENPSLYINFQYADFSEGEFLNELVKKTDCGLLLDINNIYVSCFNNQNDPLAYINQFPVQHVKEIHLAGHTLKQFENKPIRIDDHGSEVCAEVWHLYSKVLEKTGPVPTQIEWDNNIPKLETWLQQAQQANKQLEQCNKVPAC